MSKTTESCSQQFTVHSIKENINNLQCTSNHSERASRKKDPCFNYGSLLPEKETFNGRSSLACVVLVLTTITVRVRSIRSVGSLTSTRTPLHQNLKTFPASDIPDRIRLPITPKDNTIRSRNSLLQCILRILADGSSPDEVGCQPSGIWLVLGAVVVVSPEPRRYY